MTSPFKGAIQRAMAQATQGRSAPKGRFSGALARVMSRAASQRPVKTVTPTKGHGFRNAGPIKPSVSPVAEADAALAQTGEGLRKTIGKIATGRRVIRRKEGGKVGSAMSALQSLAKRYRAALDSGDMTLARRLKREMELKKEDSPDEPPAEKKAREDKLATFAEGGKVSKVAKALHAFKVGDKVRVGKHTGEIVGFDLGDDIATVDIGEAIDDGMNDGFAEVNVKRLQKVEEKKLAEGGKVKLLWKVVDRAGKIRSVSENEDAMWNLSDRINNLGRSETHVTSASEEELNKWRGKSSEK